MTETTAGDAFSDADYAALAAFRYALRRFLVFSETAARAAGLPPQQHQALLAIRGASDALGVGQLAERLLIAPHTAAELAERLDRAGLIERRTSAEDRRRTELRLTAKAETLLRDLSAVHRAELRDSGPALRLLLQAAEGRETPPSA